jgi:hypothetical protein
MELAKRSWPEIMAHIPRNLESGETPLTEPSSGRLGFKLSHIRFDWLEFVVLRSGCFSGLTLFGQNCRMNHPEIVHQNKARQILESKTDGEQNYKDDEAFDYKLFDTIIDPSILRLH